MAHHIWLLTEERPKAEVVKTILVNFAIQAELSYSVEDLKIIPIMEDGKFQFAYTVNGFTSDAVKQVIILPVSGYSSFVDFMLFYQDKMPVPADKPLLLIEETKTDDSESRNTGVYQRSSKFVFTDFFYPDVRKLMLYNLQIPQKEEPTATSIFGTRMLLTIGVEIIGKKDTNPDVFKPFESVDELIDLKNSMDAPHYGVPIKFTKGTDTIYLSAKLEKSGHLTHDPNIGATAIIAACLRKLGWQGRIIITKHGLPQGYVVRPNNKFNYIAHRHKIELENIALPSDIDLPREYWKKETEKEKTGTILLHVICENLVAGQSIYENHGGCERGYFLDHSRPIVNSITIPKYTNTAAYKAGDKTAIIYIPDLVIYDKRRNQVINIEGKKFSARQKGVEELENFDYFETAFIKKYYPEAAITRALVLAGAGDPGVAKSINCLAMYLSNDGTIYVGKNASPLILEALNKLSRL